MDSRLLSFIVLFVVLTVVCFILTAFVQLSIDIRQWTQDARFVTSVMVGVAAMIAGAVSYGD